MFVGRTAAIPALALLVAGVAIGCGANEAASDAGLSSANGACPVSFGDVATASCHVEGLSCTYLVPCATFPANAVCTCTGGLFSCSGFGDAGTSCPAATTGKCPLAERSANGLFCSDLGLICTYPSACTDIPTYDPCQCVGGGTPDEQSHYECDSPCQADGSTVPPAPDATVPDATATPDANRPDAPIDAPSPDSAD
jgi:hypothetical protein